MNKLITLLGFAIISMVSNAQIDSTIYGLSVSSTNTMMFFVKIDPVSGQVTNISNSPVFGSFGYQGSTIDPNQGIYYNVNDSILFAFDLVSGNLLREIPITNFQNSTFNCIVYNSPNSALYGLAVDPASQEIYLGTIDPLSGVVNIISPTYVPGIYSTLAGVAVDSHESIFYYISIDNHFVGLNMSNGEVITNPVIIAPDGSFGSIVYNCLDSVIYGLCGDPFVGRKLSKIDPISGVVTYISDSIIAHWIGSDKATIDPFQEIYYFKAGDSTFVGADIHTGEIVTNPDIIPIPGTFFHNAFFNHPCDISYPVGNDPDPVAGEIVLFPNPVKNQLNIKFPEPVHGNIVINDIKGDFICSKSIFNRASISIDIPALKNGLYVIRLTTSGNIVTLKFVVKN